MLTIEQISSPDAYALYDGISQGFLVTSVLDCEPVDSGLGGIRLCEKPVASPYRKYDDSDGPSSWALRRDLSQWHVLLAVSDGHVVGGATVAPPAPDMSVCGTYQHIAVLWDIRVAPDHRGRGIGKRLFAECAAWAKDHGYRVMDVETQNTNVPGCRFYARMGCELSDIRRFAYAHCPQFAHEAMLIWQLQL